MKENEILTKEEVRLEAASCLNCRNPSCVKACPANLKINQFIHRFNEGDLGGAYRLILEESPLSLICSVVCNHEKQCIGNCIKNKLGKPVRVALIEKHIALNASHSFNKTPSIGKQVAVVGSGPSSLSAAFYLANKGIDVDVYEAKEHVGGILSYGIPSFRLPNENIERTIKILSDVGVNFITNTRIDDLEKLKKEYWRIYIGVGYGSYHKLGLDGEDLAGIYDAGTFLSSYNQSSRFHENKSIQLGETVVTIGGGNVAIDAARTALRCGAKRSFILYRRTEKELPASKAEIDYAIQDGVIFKFLVAPLRLAREEGKIKSLTLSKMILQEEGEDGRRKVIASDDTELMDVDNIILAIGQKLDESSLLSGLKMDGNRLEVDERLQTSDPKVYAGGDIVSGPANVARAVTLGRKAALSIIEDLEIE